LTKFAGGALSTEIDASYGRRWRPRDGPGIALRVVRQTLPALGECQQFFKPPSVTFFMFYLIIEQRRADHIGLLFVSRGPKYADSILKMEPSRAECWPILSKKVSKCYFLPLSWEIILLLIIAHIKMKFVIAKM